MGGGGDGTGLVWQDGNGATGQEMVQQDETKVREEKGRCDKTREATATGRSKSKSEKGGCAGQKMVRQDGNGATGQEMVRQDGNGVAGEEMVQQDGNGAAGREMA